MSDVLAATCLLEVPEADEHDRRWPVLRFEVVEELSGHYYADIDIASPWRSAIPLRKLLGETARLVVGHRGPSVRQFCGILASCSQPNEGDDDDPRRVFRVRLEPAAAHVGGRETRAFLNPTLAEIVVAILSEPLREMGRRVFYTGPSEGPEGARLQDFKRPRPTCVQYRQTPLALLHRLVAEEGLAYRFRHTRGVDDLELMDEHSNYPLLVRTLARADGDGRRPADTHPFWDLRTTPPAGPEADGRQLTSPTFHARTNVLVLEPGDTVRFAFGGAESQEYELQVVTRVRHVGRAVRVDGQLDLEYENEITSVATESLPPPAPARRPETPSLPEIVRVHDFRTEPEGKPWPAIAEVSFVDARTGKPHSRCWIPVRYLPPPVVGNRPLLPPLPGAHLLVDFLGSVDDVALCGYDVSTIRDALDGEVAAVKNVADSLEMTGAKRLDVKIGSLDATFVPIPGGTKVQVKQQLREIIANGLRVRFHDNGTVSAVPVEASSTQGKPH